MIMNKTEQSVKEKLRMQMAKWFDEVYYECDDDNAIINTVISSHSLYASFSSLSPEEAKERFGRLRKGSDACYAPAKHLLSRFYCLGIGTKPDHTARREILKDLSEFHFPPAMFEFGLLLLTEGNSLGISYIESAAESNQTEAIDLVEYLSQQNKRMKDRETDTLIEKQKASVLRGRLKSKEREHSDELNHYRQITSRLESENTELLEQIASSSDSELIKSVVCLEQELTEQQLENELLRMAVKEKDEKQIETEHQVEKRDKRIKQYEDILRKNNIPFNSVFGHGESHRKDNVA